jgi:hypothetical protein
VIHAAMSWTNRHLHKFEIAGVRYAHIDDYWDHDERLLDERRRAIGTLLVKDVSAFSRLHDFGDNWRHIVVLKKVIPSDEGNNWTQCIAGENACPPEDVSSTLVRRSQALAALF